MKKDNPIITHKTYAQIATSDNNANENTNFVNTVTCVFIFNKLDEQIAMYKMIFDKLNKLEKKNFFNFFFKNSH